LTLVVTPFLRGDARTTFLSVMTWWLCLAYPLTFGALVGWAWQRRRKGPPVTIPASAHVTSDAHSIAVSRRSTLPKTLRRLVMASTLAAGVIVAFSLLDTNHDVRRSTATELQALINTTAPADLTVSILKRHHRSLWREYPTFTQHFWVEVRQEGKSAKYMAEVDASTLALVQAKGIPCPTYTQGRDFEILGLPGRLLVLLAAFITGIGVVFLFRNR
jgi:hypothetical protein